MLPAGASTHTPRPVFPPSVFAGWQAGGAAVPRWGQILAGLVGLRLLWTLWGRFQKMGKAEHCKRLEVLIPVVFELWITVCLLAHANIMDLFLVMGCLLCFMKTVDYRTKSLEGNKTLPIFAFLPPFHCYSCFFPSLAWCSSLCISHHFPADPSFVSLK